MMLIPAFLTRTGFAHPLILTQNRFQVFLTRLLFVQCETPESRVYTALRILVRNPGYFTVKITLSDKLGFNDVGKSSWGIATIVENFRYVEF